MPSGMKMRSVSVEDLGNIVKQMIHGVLENNDQVAKLRQSVFEEFYFEKMAKLKNINAKIDGNHELHRQAMQSQISISEFKVLHKPNNSEIGDRQTTNIETDFPQDLSLPERSDFHKISTSKVNGSILVDCEHSKVNVTKSSKSKLVLSSERGSEKSLSCLVIDELDPPVMHVMRRQKYIRISQEPDVQITNIHDSKCTLGTTNYHTSMDPTQTVNDPLNSREAVNSGETVSNNVDIIEWWSSKFWRKTLEQNNTSEKPKEIPVQFKSKGEIAFENWKKGKTDAYHRIFKDEQRKKRFERAAKAKEIEKKEAANEAYMYWRKQQDARQKLRNTRKRILAQMEVQKLQFSERCRANSQAFKVWKRQKDVKLREMKMYMTAYNEQNYPQQQTKPQKSKSGIHVAFNIWLNQLDCVLHQKYLRERRYLVRSFYCQPAYFGSAALCTR